MAQRYAFLTALRKVYNLLHTFVVLTSEREPRPTPAFMMLRSLLAYSLFLSAFSFLAAQNPMFTGPTTIARNSAEVGVADFDGDGFNDIAVCGSSQRWYKGPDFTTWYEIGLSDGGPYAARVADMNADGFPDFVTSDGARETGDYPGHVYVYLHPGAGGDPTQPWQRITVYTGDVRHQNDMRLVDIDGDGRLDILEKTWSATERVLIAFQNADINNWTVRTFVTNETGKPEGISAGDIDGDGVTEIIQSGVYWDMTGDWRTDQPTLYTIDGAFYQSVFDKTKSEVGDIDGDGDLDVYIGSAEGSDLKLSWYENTGLNPDGSVTWVEHLIRGNYGKCHVVELEDVDQDGDLDLFTARSFGQSGVFVFYNDGAGNFTQTTISANNEMYTGQVADLDNDGDMDLVGPLGFYRQVQYYINDGPGCTPTAPVTASPAGGAYVQPPTVTLSGGGPGASIFYTTDGSTPTAASTPYLGSFTLNTTTTLRAFATGTGICPTPIITEAYQVARNGNFPPDADAGPDQSQNDLVTVTLDGSGTTDLDDPVGSLSYAWAQVSGPSVTLTTPNSVTASFTPPSVGDYVFRLTVTDDAESATDDVTIRVTDLSASLVAFWPGDDATGTVAAELVAGNDAALTGGSTFAPGRLGTAMSFDGTSGRAESPAFDVPGSAMTITTWIRAADLDNVEGRIVSKASGTVASQHYWMVSQNGGSALRFRLNTSNGGTETLISPTGVLTAGEWIFVAAVYDGSTMRLYRNLDEVASVAKAGTITAAPNVGVAIGNQPAGAGDRPFSGLIDEVKIYDAALTAAELATEFNQGQTSLPVTWLAFEARLAGKDVQLHWATADERDNAGFTVERQSGNGSFQPIGTVAPAEGDYAFTDVNPTPGRYVYRLRQTDFDGTTSFSALRQVTVAGVLQVLPNPFTTELSVRGVGERYRLVDALGREVMQGAATDGRVRLATERLVAGVYFLESRGAAGEVLGVVRVVRR